VIGISRSARQLDTRKTVGLDIGIQASGSDVADKVLEPTGGNGVDLAANLIGGSAFPDCLRSLSHQGRLAVVGYVDEKLKAEIDLEAVHGTRSRVRSREPGRRAAAVP